MLDKTKLGTRYTCFSCGTKFYDLNRPVPTCPECSADQREAPVRDIKSLLGRSGRKKAAKKEEPKAPETKPKDEDEDEDESEESEEEESDEEESEEDAGLFGAADAIAKDDD